MSIEIEKEVEKKKIGDGNGAPLTKHNNNNCGREDHSHLLD